MWEWTRAEDLNAAETKLSMPIEWLEMVRDLCGEGLHMSWRQLLECLQLQPRQRIS